MKFIVEFPRSFEQERRYIIKQVFSFFDNCEVELISNDRKDYSLFTSESSKELILPDYFFVKEAKSWLQQREPQNWGLKKDESTEIALFSTVEHYDEIKPPDYFGTIFFFLTRYSELVEDIPYDNHERIDGKNAFLVREGLIKEPIVDIYIEKLIKEIEHKFNVHLERKTQYQVMPSHDVDRPFEFLYYNWSYLAKRMLGDLISRRSLTMASSRFKQVSRVKSGAIESDPYNTFSWIMDTSEKHGLTSTFHFIPEVTHPKKDQSYDLQNEEIKSLMKEIGIRGHQIGLHPSYNATILPNQVKKEFEHLKNITNQYGIEQTMWKNRNHYLRWNEDCLDEFEAANLDIDQTLGFAQQPGFRCGTSKAFNPFNFDKRIGYSFKVEPLILMEVSLFNAEYLNLNDNIEEAFAIALDLKNKCKKYQGNFTILWHNNMLIEDDLKQFYEECIK